MFCLWILAFREAQQGRTAQPTTVVTAACSAVLTPFCERRVGTNMQSTVRPARHARIQANAADTCKHC
jgi:hypothetical protein